MTAEWMVKSTSEEYKFVRSPVVCQSSRWGWQKKNEATGGGISIASRFESRCRAAWVEHVGDRLDHLLHPHESTLIQERDIESDVQSVPERESSALKY